MMTFRRAARFIVLATAFFCLEAPAEARPVQTRAAPPTTGTTWTVLTVRDQATLPRFEEGWEGRVRWDLRSIATQAADRVQWTILPPDAPGLGPTAAASGADRALCAADGSHGDHHLGCLLFRASETGPAGARVMWSDLPGSPPGPRAVSGLPAAGTMLAAGDRFTGRVEAGPIVIEVEGKVVAEGIVLVPAGPRETTLLRETIRGPDGVRRRYRFLTREGIEAAVLEGPLPAPGTGFAPDRADLLSAAPSAVDDGIVIPYTSLGRALVPGSTGFLQYSLGQDAVLDSIHPSWTSVAALITPDAASVWDFASIDAAALPYRTFNTTRGDLLGSDCLESCSLRDQGEAPADGTWQAWLKIDHYAPGGAYATGDVFLLNDNDTGADPSIDLPFLAQDERNVEDRTQMCFQGSAGGPERLLRFFKFTGPDPPSATMTLGDTWTSGAWTNCTDAAGLRLTVASVCGDQCYPGCSSVAPRARGLLAGGAGVQSTIVEDGFVHVAAGNHVPALLMRQDTDIVAGRSLLGVCNLGTVRNRSFDYFWLQERYGLMALVSAPSDTTGTLPPDDWSMVGNVTDRVDVTWGPFPPYQIEARACLGGTLLRWALPADGSNPGEAPGISDWGYVASWGEAGDAESLADWSTNPDHTPLPGESGYLAAPPGAEPTATVITGWPGTAVHATVVSALRYTDPGAGDVRAYRSAAFYKVIADPARLDPAGFAVGPAVDPFVVAAGDDVALSWPEVSGASAYVLRVWDLDTRQEIPCPAGLDCDPATPASVHSGAGTGAGNFAYRAHAVDPCGGVSAD